VSRRSEQVAATLHRAVQHVLSEGMNDPRLNALITVTGVQVDESLSEAVVSVSVLPAPRQNLALHGLRAAAGRIRRVAADTMDIRRTPKLVFRLDRTLKKQAAVLEALSEVAREREHDSPSSPPPGDSGPSTTVQE